MSVFLAFVVAMFAPYIGLEPGFIDDEVSRIILYPRWIPGLAALFGWSVEAAFLWSRQRSTGSGFRATARTALGAYAGAALVATVARLVLGMPFLGQVVVARGGHLTAAAWSMLILTAVWIVIGGTLAGAFVAMLLENRRAGFLAKLGTVASENGVSLAAVCAALFAIHALR